MKIRVGGRAFSLDPAVKSNLAQVETAVQNSITNAIQDEIIEIAPRQLRTLERRIHIAAADEANKVFDVITDIIDQPQFKGSGLSGDQLMRGARLPLTGFTAAGRSGGAVPWQPLSLRYAQRKSKKYPANKYRMFRASNQLRNYLKHRGPSIIQSRMGGVVVDVTGSRDRGRRAKGQGIRDADRNLLLGRITVTMFPRLSPALAPMLSSRRWTDVNQSGAMERAIFSGTAASQKLINKANPYRPLVAPTVQFFMLVRIPGRIALAVNEYVRRAKIKE